MSPSRRTASRAPPKLSGGCDLRQETTKPTLRLRRLGLVGILSGQAEIFELKPGLEMGEI